MNKAALKHRVYEATKEFVVMVLYLWLIFSLFAVYRSVILGQDHVEGREKGLALINALVLAKVMLIAKELHLGDWFDDGPLIIPAVVKSALFSAVLASFKILEEAGTGLYRGKTFQQSIAGLGGGTWPGILWLTVLLCVLLIPFFAFSELQSVLGEGNLVKIFFQSRELPPELKGSPTV